MLKQMTLDQIMEWGARRAQSRRTFLKTTAVGVAALPFVGCGRDTGAGQPEESDPEGPSSLVAYAHDPKAAEEGRPACKRILDAAMMALTEKKTPVEAWQEFVTPKDVVALKLNGAGGKGISTTPEVTDMVVKSLVDAGVPENQVIIWDTSVEFTRNCGYQQNEPGSAPRIWNGNGAGYSDETVEFESGKTQFTKIVTEYATAIISIPVLKDHIGAGVTLSMKNLSHGSVNNPADLHGTDADPYIADLCALPHLRRKWRLSIIDGTRAVWDGGPGFFPNKLWRPQTIWVSVDPVALDRVGTEVIEKKRREKKEKSLADEGRWPMHILTAEKRGLGVADLKRIRLAKGEIA